MHVELTPLIGKLQSRLVDGVELFELPRAVIAIGGIGEKCASQAAELVIREAQPELLVSAGIAGAIVSKLKVGDVGNIREVVDVATGERFPTQRGGEWVLATSQDVSDAAEKLDLHGKYGADVVDMEGAAIARVARARRVEFAAIKAISDDADFAMPPMNRFIEDGKFATRRFMAYIALHPKWWSTLRKIKKNSELATANLCEAVEHLIRG